MNRPDRPTLAVLVLVAAHSVCIASFHQPALSGPDASGYFAQAKALVASGQTYLEPASALEFVGHTAVAFLLVWGIYALARWTRDDSWPWLVVAGLCVGAIPTARVLPIQPTDE